jgi:hypothetical protein
MDLPSKGQYALIGSFMGSGPSGQVAFARRRRMVWMRLACGLMPSHIS